MAKKKQTTSVDKKKLTRQLLLAFAVVLVGFLAIRTYGHHVETERTYQQDKVRFAQTEKDMAQAYDAIVQAAGKPYETQHYGSCGYTSQKYSRGSLACSTRYVLTYGVADKEQGRSLTTDIFHTIQGQYGFSKDSFRNPDLIEQVQQSFSATFNNDQQLSCDLDYTMWNRKDFNGAVSHAQDLKTYEGKQENVAWYMLRCNTDTPKALYPIQDTTS